MPAGKDSDIVFATHGLSRSYGMVNAVNDLTVSVRRGSIGLLGPNGAGKSTFIKMLMGLVRPTGGSFKMSAMPGSGTYLDKVGYMPEHDCLPNDMTAVGLVSYMGKLSGLPSEVSMERTHEILDFVGMDESRYRKIKGFSTGMKQKVKLCQSMVHDPDLVFFDEPTNGLDPEGRREMLDLIRDIAKTGKTIVLSTHLLPDVEYVCDDVMIMNNGELILYDSLANTLGSRNLAVRVRGDQERFIDHMRNMGFGVTTSGPNIIIEGGASSSDVFVSARASDVQIRYISYHSRTLEDIFLKLVGGGG
ncbi:MAG TPA: ABC transporter ATP-binding protein [Candidatus Methanofastidiosa archaeon]|nr:ABC transporter ATP-binding protein [Candidatus Methanofastidiosa archaeon]HPR41439.1 ABC transporter ATP-binding protein [Candidatus Methanofastidiosa archaeon]